jgi:beta-N-acetylhexosaminidase
MRRAPARSAAQARAAQLLVAGLAILAVAGCGARSPNGLSFNAYVATAPPNLRVPPPPTTPDPPPGTPEPDLPWTPEPWVTPVPTPVDCVATVLGRMDPAARAGQLLMVGIPSADPHASGALAAIRDQHAGGAVLFGNGWNGHDLVATTAASLQAATGGGIGVLVAGNQEGGQQGTFQAFFGDGFTAIPAASQQAVTAPDALAGQAQTWAKEMRAAGVDVDLAPVVDTGGAVWLFGRELGHDPASVAAHGAAVVRGLQSGGVAAVLKHFPGLGRVPNNTDFHDADITDSVTVADDPYLEPFHAGIAAGARFVMVSTATYSRIDGTNPAAFSPAIVTGVLRERLGFRGVVISDDLGAARSVASVPAGDRAVRFVAAGGDIVLTIVPGQAQAMASAIVARMGADPVFATRVDAAAARVLHAKAALGLIPGCTS